MPSAEEQVNFLLCCLKGSNFKPDWNRVTEELGLPSVGATQKRWSRLMQSNNGGNDSPAPADKAQSPKTTPKKTKANTTKGKNVIDEDQDDEPQTPTRKRKQNSQAKVKDESDDA